jgi:hypothetical protein
MYRAGATAMLFATNGIVIASFVGVTLWYYLKQKSKMIVQWLPFTQPLFEKIDYVEEELRWPNGTELLASERLDIREDWSFFASLREGQLHGHEAAHGARKHVKKMAKKVADAAGKVGKKLKIGDKVEGEVCWGVVRQWSWEHDRWPLVWRAVQVIVVPGRLMLGECAR